MAEPQQQPPQPQQQDGGGGGGGIGGIIRMVAMWWMISSLFKGGSTKQAVDPQTGVALPPHANMWHQSQSFQIHVFLSDSASRFDQFDDPKALLWHDSGFSYDWDEDNTRAQNVTLDEHWVALMRANRSVFAHVYVSKPGYLLDPIMQVRGEQQRKAIGGGKRKRRRTRPGEAVEEYEKKGGEMVAATAFEGMGASSLFREHAVIYKTSEITEFRPKPKIHVRRNLISGEYTDERLDVEGDLEEQAAAPEEIVLFFKPQIRLRLLVDPTAYPRGGIPALFKDHIQVDRKTGNYKPVLWFDYFWLLDEHKIEVNDTIKELRVEVGYEPISLIKWQFMMQMEESWEMQKSMGSSDREIQEFKRMLVETNPWLLGVTMIVSTVHMVFDFLAFKNDIQFWRQKKSMRGLSVRSILLSSFMQVVVFLYLLDNDTSWMILFSSGIGMVIEFWKIRQAADVRFDLSLGFPFFAFKAKRHNSGGEGDDVDDDYETSQTDKYDQQAMKYLSWALYPLVIGYSIYSLKYEDHKSWYSWILGSLVGTVYTFGFIMMCPQLYLNYKLKSVAHLPWRMLTYKALNTFIDDLFAFIIKMPTLHRLACFRDDIVFFIFLYQKWIYRTDYTRANEFGIIDKSKLTPTQLLEVELGSVLDRLPKRAISLVAQYAAAADRGDSGEEHGEGGGQGEREETTPLLTNTNSGSTDENDSVNGLRRRNVAQ